jgi:hypothetical protein
MPGGAVARASADVPLLLFCEAVVAGVGALPAAAFRGLAMVSSGVSILCGARVCKWQGGGVNGKAGKGAVAQAISQVGQVV